MAQAPDNSWTIRYFLMQKEDFKAPYQYILYTILYPFPPWDLSSVAFQEGNYRSGSLQVQVTREWGGHNREINN